MFGKYTAFASLTALLLTSQAVAQYHHASTAYEGAMRGEADFIRSAGEAQYWNSLASINYAEAYAQQLDNAQERIARRFEVKSMNKAYRDSKRSRLSLEETTRFAHTLAPKKLSDEQIDRATGEIHWPKALRESRYAELTLKLEALLAEKYNGLGLTDEGIDQRINEIGRELIASLKSNLHRYRKANDFIDAKKFVEGILVEVNTSNA